MVHALCESSGDEFVLLYDKSLIKGLFTANGALCMLYGRMSHCSSPSAHSTAECRIILLFSVSFSSPLLFLDGLQN